MLLAKEISKSYGGTPSLAGVSFTVSANSITGIIGPNGAGKSTLLRIIAGFEFPDSGEILFRGQGPVPLPGGPRPPPDPQRRDRLQFLLGGRKYIDYTWKENIDGKIGLWSKADSYVFFDNFAVETN